MYHRLAAMYQIIFDIGYRTTLLKDGAVDFVIHGTFLPLAYGGPIWTHNLSDLLSEYERCMKELGFLSFDAEMLSYGIPVAWYWQILQVIMEIPLVSLAETTEGDIQSVL